MAAPGDVLAGKYRLLRKLGSGRTGVVYEAKLLTTNAPIAVKVMQPPTDRERLMAEVRGTTRLKSHFSGRVIELDLSDETKPVLVMDLLDGQDLNAELRSVGRLSVDDAVAYLVQACAAVWEAHANGIIHRDVKPANIFLEWTTESARPRVRVLDFGLSQWLTRDFDRSVAPLTYRSPEQVRSGAVGDARSDVWSLGMTLYRALRGRLPEAGSETAEIPRLAKELAPEGLVHVVAKALAKNPDDRFDDARAFGLALLPFLETESPLTELARKELGSGAKSGDEPTTIPNPGDEPTTLPRDEDDARATLVAKEEAARDPMATMDEVAAPASPRDPMATLDEVAAPAAPRDPMATLDEVPSDTTKAEKLPKGREIPEAKPIPRLRGGDPAGARAAVERAAALAAARVEEKKPAGAPDSPVTARTPKRERPTESNLRVPIVGALVFVVLIIVWVLWFGQNE